MTSDFFTLRSFSCTLRNSVKTTAVTSFMCLRPECQLLSISPHSTRIEPPGSSVPSGKDVMYNIRHKEGHRWEIMNAVFEASVRRSKDEWRDALLSQVNNTAPSQETQLTLSASMSTFSRRLYACRTCSLSYISSFLSVSISSCRCCVKGSAKSSISRLTLCPS